VVEVDAGDLARDAELGVVRDTGLGDAGLGFDTGFRDEVPVCCGFRGWVLETCFGDVFVVGFRELLGVAVVGVFGMGVLAPGFDALEVGTTLGLGSPMLDCRSGGRGTFILSRVDISGPGRGTGSPGTLAGCVSGGEDDWSVTRGRRVQDEEGTIGEVFSLLEVDFGGHSRLSFTSSFDESLVTFDKTLVLREDAFGGGNDWRFVWFSKRPMRLATL
jgi:hypothetical protein